jgi:hypothetical protein
MRHTPRAYQIILKQASYLDFEPELIEMIKQVYSLVIRKTSLLSDNVAVKVMINLLNRSEVT